MTTPTGTPDWTKPIQGGAKPLYLAQNFPLVGTLFGVTLDVTKYNGLNFQAAMNGLDAQLIRWLVEFFDSPALGTVVDAYEVVMRGDLLCNLNVPVLGPYVQIFGQVIGGGTCQVSTLQVVGHNGGPSSSARMPQKQLAGVFGQLLGNGVATNLTPTEVCEGPAHLTLATGSAKGVATVTAGEYDGTTKMLAQVNVAASTSGMVTFWLPPMPLVLQVANTDVAAGQFWCGLWLGRT